MFKVRRYKFTSTNEKLIEVSLMFKAWPYKNKVNRGFMFKAWLYKFTSVNIKLIEASCLKRGFISLQV